MARGALVEKFLIPPVSILDSRQGYWINRKRKWWNLEVEKTTGRDENITGINEANDEIKKALGNGGFSHMGLTTSMFDPVLSEVIYTWFSKKGDVILDPFCGGSGRGLIASILEREYHGVDLREEQINANLSNLTRFNHYNGSEYNPQWYIGDSINIDRFVPEDTKANMIFSCPPYVNLEVYSNDPRDLSTLEYSKFIEKYNEIILKCFNLLEDNSFAVFVVGDVRNKNGYYYDFISDTKKCFINAGYKLYNEMIFLELIGTASMKCGRFLTATRKVAKTHQNVLVFVKGDAKIATKKLGTIELFDIDNFICKKHQVHSLAEDWS
jgi:DNA modification methylase